MKLTVAETKTLYRAAMNPNMADSLGRGIQGALRTKNELPRTEYLNAMSCLHWAAKESDDIAFVRACDALSKKIHLAQ